MKLEIATWMVAAVGYGALVAVWLTSRAVLRYRRRVEAQQKCGEKAGGKR